MSEIVPDRTMKALVYTGDQHLEIVDRPIPVPESDEYLIKVVVNGICGSDVEGFLGSERRIPPMVMGHEFSGVVAKAPGGGIYRVGEKVTAIPKLYCGECEYCKRGLVNICTNAVILGAIATDGGMTEYITVPERYVYPIKEEISLDAASFIEPLAVAVRGVENLPEEAFKAAEHILVIGAGTIGLLVIQALRFKGYTGKIAVNDKSDFRLKKSLEVGADVSLNLDEFAEGVIRETGGKRFDIAIDCVGTSTTAQNTLSSLKNAGTALWIGLFEKKIELDLHKIVTTELKILGSYTYSLDDFHRGLEIVNSGKLIIDPIVTGRRALVDGVAAYQDLVHNAEGKEIKILLINE